MSYAHMDHASWVESNNEAFNRVSAGKKSYKPRPAPLSEFQAKVMDICGMVGAGIYNAPINWDTVDWGTPGARWQMMSLAWRDRAWSTFDFHELTAFVFLCHEARIRGSISAKGNEAFRLQFSQRSAEGGMMDSHPDIDEAVAKFRAYLPEGHRISYAATTLTSED